MLCIPNSYRRRRFFTTFHTHRQTQMFSDAIERNGWCFLFVEIVSLQRLDCLNGSWKWVAIWILATFSHRKYFCTRNVLIRLRCCFTFFFFRRNLDAASLDIRCADFERLLNTHFLVDFLERSHCRWPVITTGTMLIFHIVSSHHLHKEFQLHSFHWLESKHWTESTDWWTGWIAAEEYGFFIGGRWCERFSMTYLHVAELTRTISHVIKWITTNN